MIVANSQSPKGERFEHIAGDLPEPAPLPEPVPSSSSSVATREPVGLVPGDASSGSIRSRATLKGLEFPYQLWVEPVQHGLGHIHEARGQQLGPVTGLSGCSGVFRAQAANVFWHRRRSRVDLRSRSIFFQFHSQERTSRQAPFL